MTNVGKPRANLAWILSGLGLGLWSAACGTGTNGGTGAGAGGPVGTACATFCSAQTTCLSQEAQGQVDPSSQADCTQACSGDVGGQSSACQAQFEAAVGCFAHAGCSAFAADPNTGACYQAFISWAVACDPGAVEGGQALPANANANAAMGSSTLLVKKAALPRWVARRPGGG